MRGWDRRAGRTMVISKGLALPVEEEVPDIHVWDLNWGEAGLGYLCHVVFLISVSQYSLYISRSLKSKSLRRRSSGKGKQKERIPNPSSPNAMRASTAIRQTGGSATACPEGD
jgi:hypothetical protein